ncbi:MAG TPA: hypothetical protein VNC59_01355 [Thermoanaerobaculia bacterium]|nr:hypothetical protein [Thermoanaerobaculia bacterium]
MTFSRVREGPEGPELKPVADAVSEKVWRAMIDASRTLSSLDIRHALIGGLAVGAYGWPRATRDVDFLVGDDAWSKSESGVVILRAGIPVEAHGIAVDTVSVRDDERHLLAAIETAEISEGIPVLPIAALVYLKLASPRSQDRQDVLNLVGAGANLDRVRRYLDANAPKLREKFEAIVRTARQEEE